MIKTTIELSRTKHIQGYGRYGGPSYTDDSQSTLDKLVEWNALPGNRKKRVIKHYVRTVEEPREKITYHYASEHGLKPEECEKLFRERVRSGRELGQYENVNSLVYHQGMVNRMLTVDEVVYLDIYHQ